LQLTLDYITSFLTSLCASHICSFPSYYKVLAYSPLYFKVYFTLYKCYIITMSASNTKPICDYVYAHFCKHSLH